MLDFCNWRQLAPSEAVISNKLMNVYSNSIKLEIWRQGRADLLIINRPCEIWFCGAQDETLLQAIIAFAFIIWRTNNYMNSYVKEARKLAPEQG